MEHNAVGIGKIFLSSLDSNNYNIPHLHFIVCKTSDAFNAVSLEFGLVASDANAEAAIESLIKMLVEYVIRTITTSGFSSLIETVASTAMNEFWREYRIFEFKLAEKKKDIGHDFVQKLKDSIKKQIIEEYGIEPEAKFSVIGEAA